RTLGAQLDRSSPCSSTSAFAASTCDWPSRCSSASFSLVIMGDTSPRSAQRNSWFSRERTDWLPLALGRRGCWRDGPRLSAVGLTVTFGNEISVTPAAAIARECQLPALYGPVSDEPTAGRDTGAPPLYQSASFH